MTEEELVYAPQLSSALETLKSAKGKDYVEILSSAESSEQVKLRLRIYDLETWTHQFLPVLFKEELRGNNRSEEEQWHLHICRQYMYDEVSKKLKFFWNFILSSAGIEQAVRDLCMLIDMFVVRMEEMPAPPPIVQSFSRRGVRKKTQGSVSPGEEDLFTGRGADGAVVEGGQVVSIPLLSVANRNVPEGGFFEKGKGQKGAHNIGGG